MIKGWKPLYEMYFNMGFKHFSFHVEDRYAREHLAMSMRNYLSAHKLDTTYRVDTENKTVTVTHRDLFLK